MNLTTDLNLLDCMMIRESMVEEIQITMRKRVNRDQVEGSVNLMIRGRHIQIKAKNQKDFWKKAEITMRQGGFSVVTPEELDDK